MENYQLDMIRSGGVFLTEEVEKAIFKRSEKIKALPWGEMKALPFSWAKKICFRIKTVYTWPAERNGKQIVEKKTHSYQSNTRTRISISEQLTD